MTPPVALRYMLDFQCAGSACEDTCCGGWEIEIGQGPYTKIKRALEKDAQAGLLGGADPATLVQLAPPHQRTREHFAILRETADQRCSLLDEERLCSLQRRHGAALLPEGCALFPRVYRRVGERLELTGSLACPEVVRRAMLTEGATDIYQLKQSAPATRHGDEQAGAGVAQSVRTVLCDLMSRRDHSFTTTLLCVAWLAYRTDDLFEPAAGQRDAVATAAALARFKGPQQLAELAQRFLTLERARTDALPLIEAMVDGLQRARSYRAFHVLVNEVWASYGDDRSALAATFAARRSAIVAVHGEAVDLYLRNFGRHYVVKHWPSSDGSLKHHVQGLLLRVAMMRFLLLSHPEAVAAAGSADRGALDKIAVRVVYAFSRHIEHSPQLLVQFAQLAADNLQAIENAVSLICL